MITPLSCPTAYVPTISASFPGLLMTPATCIPFPIPRPPPLLPPASVGDSQCPEAPERPHDPSKLASGSRVPLPLGPEPTSATSATAAMATMTAFTGGERVHQDVSRAMQDAARKYHRRSRILEDNYQRRPSPGEYERMAYTLNQTKFIPPLDSHNTKANLYYIRRKFERYCLEVKKQQWQTAIRPHLCDKGFIQAFLHWICSSFFSRRRRNIKYKTINQYWRDFKMLYRRANEGREINKNDCEEIVKYCTVNLKTEFELDNQPGSKPVASVKEMMKVLVEIWFGETSYFQTEDDRLNCATIVLLQGYTGCRPAELTDATKKRGGGNPLQEFDCSNGEPMSEGDLAGYETDTTEIGGEEEEEETPDEGDQRRRPAATPEVEKEDDRVRLTKALCYEDLTLWIVKDPKGGRRDVLAMEVALKFHKNVDRKPKPHVLARAIRDDAILVDGYDSAEPFFNTKLSCQAVKVHWKPHMLKIPVFRRTVRSSSRTWVLSDIEAVRYSIYAYWLNRVGIALGYEDPLTSYCFRRGLVDALTHVAPDAIIDQVMRHDPMTGCRQNAYLNTRVGWNTQTAYLEEEPSDDGLTELFTHMNIRRDPRIPKRIPQEQLDTLDPGPEICELEQLVEAKHRDIKFKHRYIKRAPAPDQAEFKRLQQKLKSAKKQFRDEMSKIYRDACRRRLYDGELERQLHGTSSHVDDIAGPGNRHQLEERNQLQEIFAANRQLTAEEIISQKATAINLMAALARRREIARPTRSMRVSAWGNANLQGEVEDAFPLTEKNEQIPRILERNQCPICVGDEALSHQARTRKFTRVAHMMDHVERVHLRHKTRHPTWVCYHPDCKHKGDFLKSLDHFKNHVLTEHGVKLRK
ncbi:uncharacterized protein FRV6_15318 [Fusarium oxysporum]|uniref:Uncharacterized protein n=1 Tax=Fusarium oxysporum TaxID=5507 RepID=A0A2H3U2I9_FUSOX|nr:uncharacterized protein FRV6_15318 [Fusarium oxysporum]